MAGALARAARSTGPSGRLTVAARTRVTDRIVTSASRLAVVSARQHIDDTTARRLRDIVTELELSAREMPNVGFASRAPAHRVDDISRGFGT